MGETKSKLKRVVLTLQEEEYQRLTEAAARLGMSKQRVIRLMMRAYLPKLLQALGHE